MFLSSQWNRGREKEKEEEVGGGGEEEVGSYLEPLG